MRKLVRWTVDTVESLPSPSVLSPTLKTVHFNLTFRVEPVGSGEYWLHIEVESLDQAIVFPLNSAVGRWKLRYGIIPWREETTVSMRNDAKKKVNGRRRAEVTFQALYRPEYTSHSRSKLIIRYEVNATDILGEWALNSSAREITILLTEDKKKAQSILENVKGRDESFRR